MKLEFLNKLNGRKIGILFFVIVFIFLVFYYNLNETMFFRPQATHAWRQTDCLSITQNYYQLNNNFFEPEIHNQLSDNDRTGKTAGEFPLLYYAVAQIWRVTGKSEFIYRLIVLLISFTGLFFIFKASQEILKNNAQSIFVSLGLFTAVTYVYYSANFLPNIPALSLVFIGWFFIWKFYKHNHTKYLWWSMFFFGLGILLKVSSGISFVALLGWLFLQFFIKKENRILFKKPLTKLLPFVAVIVVVVAWYVYAANYNRIHDGRYTFNNVWPIWEVSNEKIWKILQGTKMVTRPSFFNLPMLYITGAMWIYLLLTFKKRSLFLNYLLLIIPFGSLIYALLWFQAFNYHDYYWIDFYVNFVLVWILFFKTIDEYKWARHWAVSIVILGLFFHNASECNKLLNSKYVGWQNATYLNHLKAVGELEPVFKRLGIGANDKVISIPDKSINISLYLMNRRGFTNYNSYFEKPGNYQKRIQQGAKYLIVNDTTILNDSLLQPFTKHLLITYQNVKIYDLHPYLQ